MPSVEIEIDATKGHGTQIVDFAPGLQTGQRASNDGDDCKVAPNLLAAGGSRRLLAKNRWLPPAARIKKWLYDPALNGGAKPRSSLGKNARAEALGRGLLGSR